MNRIFEGIRDDWRRAAPGGKIVLMVLGGLGIPLLAFLIAFYVSFDF